jgi:hypothetical protein
MWKLEESKFWLGLESMSVAKEPDELIHAGPAETLRVRKGPVGCWRTAAANYDI